VRYAAALAVLTWALAGCAAGGGAGHGTEERPEPVAGAAAATDGRSVPADRTLATLRGDGEGANEPIPLTLRIHDLRRQGDLLLLQWSVTNEAPRASVLAHSWFNPSPMSSDVGGVTLVDPRGRKRYLAARDAEGSCVCSHPHGVSVAPRGRLVLSAAFAAPPGGVDRLNVEFPRIFGTAPDVPVSSS
jgi:hypothetical protein